MHEINVSVSRLDDLMSTINEAKRSLDHWQDKKTEALIRLDSFTYDIQQIEAEKIRNRAAMDALHEELETSRRIFQSQVSELTDQLQELKFENETLKNDVIERNIVIGSREKEIESQKILAEHATETLIKNNLQKENEIRLDLEAKFSNQLWEQKVENEALRTELKGVTFAKAQVDERISLLENELNHIRAHMMNALQVTESSYEDVKKAIIAPVKNAAPKKMKAAELSIQEVKELRQAGSEPASVQEYLQRLGY